MLRLDMLRDAVWITGVQGFIGRHLARTLTDAGVRVVGFHREAPRTASASVQFFPLNAAGFADAIARHGLPKRAFHLAGGATVGRSFADPHDDFLSNVVTTEALLEALRGHAVPVVLASSAAIYGEGHPEPIHTDETPTPASPYGNHKMLAEHLVQAHAQTFDLPVTVLRLFSIYGPGLRKQLLFDVCSRLSASGSAEPITLGGTGTERRDWLEVTDVIKAMQSLADPDPGEVRTYNLASGRASEIREVASHIVAAWAEPREVIFSGDPRPGDPFSLVADQGSLPPGFVPQVALADGISRFVSWFRAGALPDAANSTTDWLGK